MLAGKRKIMEEELSLLDAAKNGDLEIVHTILKTRPHPRQEMNRAMQQTKSADIIWTLLEAGADIRVLTGLSLPLAASQKHTDLFKRLFHAQLLWGMDTMTPEASRHWHSLHALITASAHGHLYIVDFLLNHNIIDQIALFSACENGHLNVVHRLLLAGIKDDLKNTALIAASSRGYVSIVKRLLHESPAGKGHAMQIAARKGQLDVVRFLLTQQISDLEKNNALLVACWEKQKPVIRFLLQNGATFDPNWKNISQEIQDFIKMP